MLRNQDRLSILLELVQDFCCLTLQCCDEFSSHGVILEWYLHIGKGLITTAIDFSEEQQTLQFRISRWPGLAAEILGSL